MKKSLLLKIGAILLLLALIGVAWLYDFYRAKFYKVELTYLSDETPIASQKDVVDFTIRVTKNGVPCADHEVSAVCSKGQMIVMIARTDADGYVDFSYAPYNECRYAKAGEVVFEIADLSNSLFVEVHATLTFSIVLQSPEGEK